MVQKERWSRCGRKKGIRIRSSWKHYGNGILFNGLWFDQANAKTVSKSNINTNEYVCVDKNNLHTNKGILK